MFHPIKRVVAWFTEGISTRAKIILALCGLMLFGAMGFTGYKINDYFENNPEACMMCHVHDDANKAWAQSAHRMVNCHECHHSTKKEQVVQMYRFAVLGQKKVEPRHGKIIVPSKLCMECHWEINKKFPMAPQVNRSAYHAKHVFMEKIECTRCHGYRIHKFETEERFCFTCHKGKEVHGTGMEQLACLNCHTDRTTNLRPGRKKCLYCHGSDAVRKELIADGTIDVKRFPPSPAIINKATKINVPANAPMQFYCYECHRPHGKVKPDVSDCVRCHEAAPGVGKHELHVKMMNMKCTDCHKPHVWKVTPAQAKKDCTKCHEYKDPGKFLGTS
ncbi:MAG: cytochrome c3 family protein [Nitrospirota bacterium]